MCVYSLHVLHLEFHASETHFQHTAIRWTLQCTLPFVGVERRELETHELQRVAFGVSLNLNLQSQSHWSLFYETWQKRPRVLDHRLRFETGETTLQMQ